MSYTKSSLALLITSLNFSSTVYAELEKLSEEELLNIEVNQDNFSALGYTQSGNESDSSIGVRLHEHDAQDIKIDITNSIIINERREQERVLPPNLIRDIVESLR